MSRIIFRRRRLLLTFIVIFTAFLFLCYHLPTPHLLGKPDRPYPPRLKSQDNIQPEHWSNRSNSAARIPSIDHEKLNPEKLQDIEPVVQAPKLSKEEEFALKYNIFPVEIPPRSGPNSVGPGEGGDAYVVDKETLSPEEKKKFELGWKNSAFNEYVSDKISIRRYLKDQRYGKCIRNDFEHDLPTTSIVMCFHNEAWSVLLRSVHSIIDNSPPHLLKEIVLVDDFSDKEYLHEPLEHYMKKLKIVKIVRAKEREGLIRARILGANAATGDVLTFLDSHIECNTGWLEPLLERIKFNKTIIAIPVITVLSDQDFTFHGIKPQDVQIGRFQWDLIFHWGAQPERDRNRPGAPYSPLRTPTMAGGLFSIDRDYFSYLGKYDPGMYVWGGENLELSFKAWMCGGSLETVVCSLVGHVFRKRSPYKWESKVTKPLQRNLVRLSEVWLDDYKYFYQERLNFQLGDYGDISERIQLRKDLKCHSFKWYLDNIIPELFVPADSVAHGDIESEVSEHCLDALSDLKNKEERIKGWPCHRTGGNQYWMMSKFGEIRRDNNCWDSGITKGGIGLSSCHGQYGNQKFDYNEKNQLKHETQCVELSQDFKSVHLATCSSSPYQRWKFSREPYKLGRPDDAK